MWLYFWSQITVIVGYFVFLKVVNIRQSVDLFWKIKFASPLQSRGTKHNFGIFFWEIHQFRSKTFENLIHEFMPTACGWKVLNQFRIFRFSPLLCPSSNQILTIDVKNLKYIGYISDFTSWTEKAENYIFWSLNEA